MKKILSHIYLAIAACLMMACQSEEAQAMPPADNSTSSDAKTLIVYYSYTGNTKEIVDDLRALITADVVEVVPAEKGLNYAANNYRIGTEQLTKIQNAPNDASSYPAIEFSAPDGEGQEGVVDMSKYSTVIIATPLWWSQMASNMQTFLFRYGPEMAGKNVGLIVSSHSSGISGVEADAHRLVPNGNFFAKSLWINASNHSRRKALLDEWLKAVDYSTLTALSLPLEGSGGGSAADNSEARAYSLSGQMLAHETAGGVHIKEGKKRVR